MNKNNIFNFKRILQAFKYSISGLIATFQSEPAFRQEVFLAVILIPVALLINVAPVYKELMISSIFLILICELANTAIEAIVDRISIEHHTLSKKAKDVGSTMVFIAFINAILIWLIALI